MFSDQGRSTRLHGNLAVIGWIAVAVALAATVPALAKAEPFKVKNLRAISGPSPFAAGCPGALQDDTNITGYELEPMITVNPANRRNIIATWKQDAGPFDGTRSDLIASSLDNGKTWSRSTIPGIGVCTGGTADAVSDHGSQPPATAASISVVSPPTCRPSRRRPRSPQATPAMAGAPGQRRQRSLRHSRAMRRMRSPAVPRSPDTLTWPGQTSSRPSRSRRARSNFRARPTVAPPGRP